ncbi:hypothetical protein BGW80DRAFT_870463 [Lactifluus volemus]|nr:hypothetical protein BGW80DRAFT_870463 [Lactifluus volemus]
MRPSDPDQSQSITGNILINDHDSARYCTPPRTVVANLTPQNDARVCPCLPCPAPTANWPAPRRNCDPRRGSTQCHHSHLPDSVLHGCLTALTSNPPTSSSDAPYFRRPHSDHIHSHHHIRHKSAHLASFIVGKPQACMQPTYRILLECLGSDTPFHITFH